MCDAQRFSLGMVRDGCRRSEAKGVLEVPNQLRRQAWGHKGFGAKAKTY